MTSPISKISSLTIGTVESVAPDEIKVLLDIDSPEIPPSTPASRHPFRE